MFIKVRENLPTLCALLFIDNNPLYFNCFSFNNFHHMQHFQCSFIAMWLVNGTSIQCDQLLKNESVMHAFKYFLSLIRGNASLFSLFVCHRGDIIQNATFV